MNLKDLKRVLRKDGNRNDDFGRDESGVYQNSRARYACGYQRCEVGNRPRLLLQRLLDTYR